MDQLYSPSQLQSLEAQPPLTQDLRGTLQEEEKVNNDGRGEGRAAGQEGQGEGWGGVVVGAGWWVQLIPDVYFEMGGCMGGTKPISLPPEAMQQIRSILSKGEIYILHLMYLDLAQRVADHKINLQNFLLFFHKNGYWGERLFKEFDYDESSLISEQEFIRGIAKIFKSTEKEKISLLFKFFSQVGGDKSEGIVFSDFLTMLYNYPKEDLREILNDKEFIEYELKNHLVPVSTNKSTEVGHNCYSLESTSNVRQYLPSANPANLNERLQNKFGGTSAAKGAEDTVPSMIGREIAKKIQQSKKGKSETVIQLKYEDKVLDIKTINIQQLVKKFAQKIFKEAKIEVKTGRLNFQQFYDWICIHKALYENYYDGFHNQIWETDQRTSKPKYLTINCEKTTDAMASVDGKLQQVRLFLQHSILVICLVSELEQPIMVICLEGLAVRRIFEIETGFGIEISHRDGVYKDKKFFFKNEEILIEWVELLKFFKGDSVQKMYDVGEKIGTGKFSVVYRCVSFEDKEEYALKEIPTFKLDPEAKNLIAHESAIMQIVSHPLLLEFKECIQSKTHIYIITELVKGKDLFEFVKDYGYLDEYDAAKIAQQLIVGVRVLHSFEIVHRDLKPENIMVVVNKDEEVENIKIIDFGFSNYLSKLQEKKGDEDLLAGTPNYIAPEVLREEVFGFKIDNFAIGVILYFMLTGTLPFNDYTITQILANTLDGSYEFGDSVVLSDESKDLVDKLLKNDPLERISLEQALEHDWFKILSSPRKNKRKMTNGRQNTKKYDFLR